MTTIYDDVFYIETLKDMDENNKIKDEGEIEEIFHDNDDNDDDDNDDNDDNDDEYCELFEHINRKKMFEKLLKETLEELNKTNPALESSKYHMLCLQASRYNRYISCSKYKILIYEIKIFIKNRKNHIENCFWCYWFKHYDEIDDEIVNYKPLIDKKND